MSDEPETSEITRNFIIVASAVLILIFLLIIFGINKEPPQPKTNVIEYNFFEFEQINNFWETDIQLGDQLFRAAFRFNPEQVEDVQISGNFTGFKTTPIYITFDPESEQDEFKYLALGTSELALHLIRALNYTTQAACTKNVTDACIDRPIVECGQENKSVIYLVAKPPTQITLNESCITLSGQGFELVKAIDRLLFQWYKIIR